MLFAKLSEISEAVSKLAEELSRLRALLLETGRDSGSVSVATPAEYSNWNLLRLRCYDMLCYVTAVSGQVCHTIGLIFILSVSGLFSWVEWGCSIIKDIIARMYSDPRGLLLNVLILGGVSVSIGVTALACLLGSCIVRLFSPWFSGAGGLHDVLWGWGVFFLNMLNPLRWFPFGGRTSGGSSGSAAAPGPSGSHPSGSAASPIAGPSGVVSSGVGRRHSLVGQARGFNSTPDGPLEGRGVRGKRYSARASRPRSLT